LYSVRKTTDKHGSINLNVLIISMLFASYVIYNYGNDYLVILCGSSLIHIIIETGLFFTGIRKSVVYLYGYKLPRVGDILLRALVEGPAFCVPAFFVADRLLEGESKIEIGCTLLLIACTSTYMGWADRKDLASLKKGEEALYSRRAMTKPKAVILLALVNTICISALFLIPSPYRIHAFTYIGAYSIFVMTFYLINYKFGVRFIEIYDAKKNEFKKPGPLMQASGLTYDSAYEMALLISPAYTIAFYIGLFEYSTII
jgi:hypothetical protein